MHYPEKPSNWVYLVDRDGEARYAYPSLEAAAHWISNSLVRRHIRGEPGCFQMITPFPILFRLVNDEGVGIDHNQLITRDKSRWVNEPDPGSKKQNSYRNCLRSPKTRAEKRAYYEAKVQIDEVIEQCPQAGWQHKITRGKRSPSMLPDDYDDIPRHIDRSWKRHRAHQCRKRRGRKKVASTDWAHCHNDDYGSSF